MSGSGPVRGNFGEPEPKPVRIFGRGPNLNLNLSRTSVRFEPGLVQVLNRFEHCKAAKNVFDCQKSTLDYCNYCMSYRKC